MELFELLTQVWEYLRQEPFQIAFDLGGHMVKFEIQNSIWELWECQKMFRMEKIQVILNGQNKNGMLIKDSKLYVGVKTSIDELYYFE